jgi:hypothetical protein
MTKLCARGKAAAKRKFKVYPSAYANAYASKICAGKAKDPSGLKRKDFKGPKPAGKKTGGKVIKAALGLGLLATKKGQKAAKKFLKGKTQMSPALNYLSRKEGGFTEKLQPYSGTYIKGNLAGHEVSNPSLTGYYKGMIDG